MQYISFFICMPCVHIRVYIIQSCIRLQYNIIIIMQKGQNQMKKRNKHHHHHHHHLIRYTFHLYCLVCCTSLTIDECIFQSFFVFLYTKIAYTHVNMIKVNRYMYYCYTVFESLVYYNNTYISFILTVAIKKLLRIYI